MKTSQDPRHVKRQLIVQQLFAESFTHQQHHDKKAEIILAHLAEIDPVIQIIAPEFPLEMINKTDLAILRLALYELMIEKKEPSKVIIDEAIELAKEFGGQASPAFISGALGKYIKDQKN